MVEHRIVVPGVVGSSPISHPLMQILPEKKTSVFILGRGVRGNTPDFDSVIVGSSPAVPVKSAPVAQQVEHRPFKAGVRGSSPRWSIKKRPRNIRIDGSGFFIFPICISRADLRYSDPAIRSRFLLPYGSASGSFRDGSHPPRRRSPRSCLPRCSRRSVPHRRYPAASVSVPRLRISLCRSRT